MGILEIIISNSSSNPIYEQIYSQIREHIVSGRINEGEALPSIRLLAKDLRISVITTKRAYDELERDGFIYTVAGKGCFVAEKNVELIREQNLSEIEDYVKKILDLAATCNLSKKDLLEMFDILEKDE